MIENTKAIRLGKKESALVERIARRFESPLSADVILLMRRQIPMCVFDNPHTLRREFYIEGKECASISIEILNHVSFKGGDWFPFFFNVGGWKSNKVYGDRKALPL